MPEVIVAEVLVPSGTGLPADRASHRWTFLHPGTINDAALDALTPLVEDFYEDVPTGGTKAPIGYMRSGLVGTSWVVRYSRGNIATGDETPIREDTITLSGFGSDTVALPAECAVRISLHGEITGVQATDRRRRGGPYFGPGLGATLASSISGGQVLVLPAMTVDLALAAEELAGAASLLGVPLPLVIWSKAEATTHEVVGGFVNNAFDTIRRRGSVATARTIWPA